MKTHERKKQAQLLKQWLKSWAKNSSCKSDKKNYVIE